MSSYIQRIINKLPIIDVFTMSYSQQWIRDIKYMLCYDLYTVMKAALNPNKLIPDKPLESQDKAIKVLCFPNFYCLSNAY